MDLECKRLLCQYFNGDTTSCRPIQSVTILKHKQIGLPLPGRPILLSLFWKQIELYSTQSYYYYKTAWTDGLNCYWKIRTRSRFFNNLKFLNLTNHVCPSFSLLRNLIS